MALHVKRSRIFQQYKYLHHTLCNYKNNIYNNTLVCVCVCVVDPTGRAVYGEGLPPLACWEFDREHVFCVAR